MVIMPPSLMIARDIRIAKTKYNDEIIKLCSNESPLGTNSKVSKYLVAKMNEIHSYPDPEGYQLKEVLAKKLDISSMQILLGNGSTEVLDLLVQMYVSKDASAIILEFGYPLYKQLIQRMGGEVIEAKSCHWKYDIENILLLIKKNTKMIFIANPNNPTGAWFSIQDLQELIARILPTTIIVIDEAYYDFMVSEKNYSSAIEFVNKYPNVVVIRTFSKAFGLAGLRIGYAIAHENIIQKLHRIKQSANVNFLAQYAALIALEDHEYLNDVLRVVSEGRKFISQQLAEMNMDFISSKTNFILLNLKQPAFPVYQAFANYNIFINPMNYFGLPNSIRISIGKKEHNEKFISILRKLDKGV